ncbi:MAG: hypothetical protein Q8P11_01050 [bacterium]|nr:hypothetical protein [bacterium]
MFSSLFTAVVASEKTILAPEYVSITSADCILEMSVPIAIQGHVAITSVSDPRDNEDNGQTLEAISPICQFDVDDDHLYNNAYPLQLSLHYGDDKGYRPHVYYWDGGKKKWIMIPSIMNRITKVMTTSIHLAYAKIAVMTEPDAMYEGTGSWYADRRYTDGGATDLYPVGTHLKVTNLDTGAVTGITTTSTWDNPDKTRILDLVKTAFSKIADPRAGLIHIRIEKLF